MARRTLWLGALVAFAAMVLLLSLAQVARRAVLQGELRARSNALLADAKWRCNTLRSQRDVCLARLAAVPSDNAVLWASYVATAASAPVRLP